MSAEANTHASTVTNSANEASGKPARGRRTKGSSKGSLIDGCLRHLLAVHNLPVCAVRKPLHQAHRDVIGNKTHRAIAESKVHAARMTAGESTDRERRRRISAQATMRQQAVLI